MDSRLFVKSRCVNLNNILKVYEESNGGLTLRGF